MKSLLLIICMLSTSIVFAIEVDPNEQPERILRCDLPLTYTNGEVMPIEDIGEVRLYESQTPGVYNQTPIATTTAQNCQFTIITSGRTDGSHYYYTATVTSIRYGTEGDRSNEEVIDVVVKRRPSAPTIGWQ